jgi:hypothetical protein
MLAACTPSNYPNVKLVICLFRDLLLLLQHRATKAYIALSVIQLITSLRIRSFPGSFSSTCHLPGISLNCLSFDCKAPKQVLGNYAVKQLVSPALRHLPLCLCT